MAGRALACSPGSGMLAEGCHAYADGLAAARSLAGQLAKTGGTPVASDPAVVTSVKMALSYFNQNITSSALVLADNYNLDTHAEKDAANSPQLLGQLVHNIAAVFAVLLATAYAGPGGLSMLDVTTVMISSEFGRTHGQQGKGVDKTGTDHNPQANSVLLAGKGLVGDQVVGATDLDDLGADGHFAKISGAHNTIDAALLKKIGKPFDFERGEPSSDLPATYEFANHITSASVVNIDTGQLGGTGCASLAPRARKNHRRCRRWFLRATAGQFAACAG